MHRIIALFICAGCHFASTLAVVAELGSRKYPRGFAEYFRSRTLQATLVSLDFMVLALLIGWSFLQLYIAYRLSGKNVNKATALCWIVTCVEALYLVLFVYGLFGSSPSEESLSKVTAASIIFTTLVGWQFIFSILVSSFLNAQFEPVGTGPLCRCSQQTPEYEVIV